MADHADRYHPIESYSRRAGGSIHAEPWSGRPKSGYDSLNMESVEESSTQHSHEEIVATQHSTLGQRLRRLWLWEILACMLSLVSIVAVIVVLLYEDGKPLDQWPWSVGPTAVVAFISTIAKASMLMAVTEVLGQLKWQHFYGQPNRLLDLQRFDDAGRSPYGALQLLARKHVKTTLASLASIIVLVSLLVDPFMQLVFAFPSESHKEPDGIASFNITESYDPNGSTFDAHMTAYTASSMNADMQSTIIGAVGSPFDDAANSCSTGNCTWSNVTTLGVCSECANVTDQVKIKCPGRTTANNGQYQCNYFMPSGRNVSGFIFRAGATGDDFPTQWNSTASAASSLDRSPAGSPALLTEFDAVQFQASLEPGADFESFLHKPVAWHCQFTLCLKTYESINVTDGKVALAPSRSIETRLVHTGNTTANISEPIGPGLYGIALLDVLRQAEDSANTATYLVNQADEAALAAYLEEMFSTGWGQRGFGASSSYASSLATVPNLGFEFSRAADLGQTAQNIADAITETMRNTRNATAAAAGGQALRTRIYIRVQWGFVALPVALALGSLVLVVIMIVSSVRGDLPVWKNSSLALLSHSVEGWAWQPDDLAGPLAMEKMAGMVSVVLPKGSDELVFRRSGG
ncbi:hypothetical protein F4780DRAFT_739178 [Xylariomycetidae sp. FL0641]|nr:hypothetical protein F4780DRAFT_739178 [Xylariomycetidae sp. FL0641]